MGGCQLTNLAFIHPRLLHTVILLDPVIQENTHDPRISTDTGHNPARASTFRRDIWPSRSIARSLFLKSPYYTGWDKRVFELWMKHGIRDTPTALYPDERNGTVTLATTRNQEVWTFLRERFLPGDGHDPAQREAYPDMDPNIPSIMAFYRPEPPRTLERLPELRPSVLYIFGGDSYLSTPSMIKEKMERTGVGQGGSGGVKAGRVKEVTLKGRGHLIAMEAVEDCADPIAEWLGKELGRWRKDQEAYKEWTKIPLRERQVVSEEWKKRIGGPFQRKPKAKM